MRTGTCTQCRGPLGPLRRTYCGNKCAREAEVASKRARAHATRHATVGRMCRYCSLYDSEGVWSSSEEMCVACYRKRGRNGLCECGRILVCVTPRKLCPICDEIEYGKLGYIKIIMLAPTDDRERILWRPRMNRSIRPDTPNRRITQRLGIEPPFDDIECITATPEQWAKIRA